MATTVEETKTITIDDVEIEMRPLKIKALRKFMSAFDKLVEAGSNNDKSLDALLECVAIAMGQYNAKFSSVEKLEELLDLQDIYKIIEAAAGIKLGDDAGNLRPAAPLGVS